MAKAFDVAAYKVAQIETAVASYNKGDKGISAFVKDTLTAYTKLSVRLHLAACMTFYKACETGDPRILTDFFNGLRKNDQDALRLWVGKMAWFQDVDADGNAVDKHFMAYKKDKGFIVVKGTEEHRKGHYTLAKLFDGKSFQDIDQKKENALDLADLIAKLLKIEKTTKKQADDNGVPLPAGLVAVLHSFTKDVERVGLTANAKPANESVQLEAPRLIAHHPTV